METELITMLFQYGLAGVALYMMYSITYNHLVSIDLSLERIEQLLEQIRGILSKA